MDRIEMTLKEATGVRLMLEKIERLNKINPMFFNNGTVIIEKAQLNENEKDQS